jgi:hypothetical protein
LEPTVTPSSLFPFYFTSVNRTPAEANPFSSLKMRFLQWKPKQARGLYPTKIWFPEFRAPGFIAAVSF